MWQRNETEDFTRTRWENDQFLCFNNIHHVRLYSLFRVLVHTVRIKMSYYGL